MFPFAPAPETISGTRPTTQQPDAPLGDDDRTGLRVLYPDAADPLHQGSVSGRIIPANPPRPSGLSAGCDWSFRRARRGCRQYDGGGNRRNDRGDGVALRRGRCSLTARTKLPDCLQEAATRFMQNRSTARRTLRNSIMPRSRFAATPMSDAGWPPLQACFVPVVDVGLTNKDSARAVSRLLFSCRPLGRFFSLESRFSIAVSYRTRGREILSLTQA